MLLWARKKTKKEVEISTCLFRYQFPDSSWPSSHCREPAQMETDMQSDDAEDSAHAYYGYIDAGDDSGESISNNEFKDKTVAGLYEMSRIL